MEIIEGCRVRTKKISDQQNILEGSFLEARIVDLFQPWLKSTIPDPQWCTMMKKLGILLRSAQVKK